MKIDCLIYSNIYMMKLCFLKMMLCLSICLATLGNTTYFHLDPAGTPLMATNEAGAVVWKETYLPYGEKHQPSISGGSNTIGYAGKPYDNATGLSYMGARYYNPVLGRFTGIDPVGFNPDNLHSHNRYAYANNNPYKYVDPDGRVAFLAAIPPALAYLTPIAAGISARIAMSSVYRFGMSMAIGETGFVAPASLALGAGKVASVVAKEAGVIKSVGSTLQPGKFAGESITARSTARDFSKAEREALNEIGNNTGCHTCGTKDPGTKSGNFIPDHQPVSSLKEVEEVQKLYPHCIDCSRKQGGEALQSILRSTE
jgi:RHS repeat-associated protein